MRRAALQSSPIFWIVVIAMLMALLGNALDQAWMLVVSGATFVVGGLAIAADVFGAARLSQPAMPPGTTLAQVRRTGVYICVAGPIGLLIVVLI